MRNVSTKIAYDNILVQSHPSRRFVMRFGQSAPSCRSITPLRHAVRPGRSIMALAHAASSDNVQQLLCNNRSLTIHELAPTMHTCKELQQRPVKDLRSVFNQRCQLHKSFVFSYCHRPMYMTMNIMTAQRLTSLKRNVERHGA